APFAIALVAVAILAVSEPIRQRQVAEPLELSGQLQQLLRRQWLPLAQIGFMVVLTLWRVSTAGIGTASDRHFGALGTTILANAALVGFALWLIRLGLREDRGQPFAAGVGLFLLWIVLRYVDLFGDFGGMLGAAAMFFLCGAVLFGVALY